MHIFYGRFLSNSAPTTAIAMIMAVAVIAKYMIMSELETDDCTDKVGAGVLDGVMLTVAYVVADEV